MTEFEATLEHQICTVNVACCSQVIIDKLYGPLCMDKIKVSIDYDKCQWVIHRSVTQYDNDGDYVSDKWVEVARVDGQ